MQKKKKMATSKGQWQSRMDLKPTKKRVVYSFMLSIFIAIFFFGFYAKINRIPSAADLLAPEDFHLIYVIPILSFLASYFTVCWFIIHNSEKKTIKQLK